MLEASHAKAVLVDVWAPWCGPCRIVGPVIDEVAQTLATEATVGKLNADENAELLERYQVTSIPTVLVFRRGRVVDALVGVREAAEYVAAARSADRQAAA